MKLVVIYNLGDRMTTLTKRVHLIFSGTKMKITYIWYDGINRVYIILNMFIE